jgi:hypothetical protein
MAKFSRILAVVTAVLSIAFLGFAGVTTLGGPNWRTVAARLAPTTDDPAGYVFTQSLGENPQWTATSTRGEAVKTATVLPDVIVAAYDHKLAALREELNQLNEEQPQLEQRKQGMEGAIQADQQALAQAVAQRQQYLEQLRQEYVAISQQVVQKSEEAQQIEQRVDARRQDVFRLDNQLELLDAHHARIEQIEQQMLDLIRQIDADLAKAERRQEQLESRLGENAAAEDNGQAQPGQ